MLGEHLTNRQKRVITAVILGSGTAGFMSIRSLLRNALIEQQKICCAVGLEDPKATVRRARAPKVAVDAIFARRLSKILRICIPSATSYEALLIYTQTVLLVARSLLTDVSSKIEGGVGRFIIANDQPRLKKLLLLFTAVAVPAAVVNSALKYLQKRIKLAFMRRLTHHLHENYFRHRAYYAATWLGGLSAADQRLTEDVEKFAYSISELYSYTLKPALDVVLFSRSLSELMGYRAQFMLYGYYVFCSAVLRITAPPLAHMTAQEAALAGSFRSAHARLSAHAEEVAYNDPPAGLTEQMILNQHLHRLLRYSRLSAFQTFIQTVADGYLLKYMATVVALAVYAANAPSHHLGNINVGGGGKGGSAASYIRAMRLLNNTSRGIGDLVQVYKRLATLSGHTSRVSELLEQVAALGGDTTSAAVRTTLFLRNVSSSGSRAPPQAPDGSLLPPPDPKRSEGAVVAVHRLYLNSPEGQPLLRELSFTVDPGSSVLLMGPNGSGKSSLLRVAAGLWPLSAGEVTLPQRGDVFYLSQRPYMVPGTLRDLILYPEPPRSVYATASPTTKQRVMPFMKSSTLSEEELEERLEGCLDAVELDYLLGRGKGWDQVQKWDETLSGGEKQRLAMARLLFHSPKYAILDEATSAVSAEGEIVLYKACVEAGITMLSIGHRPALRHFHSVVVHLEGGVGGRNGKGWHLEQLRDRDIDGLGGDGVVIPGSTS